MKILKYSLLAAAATLALGFSACSDDDDYKWTNDTKGVYFPNDCPTTYEVPDNQTTLEIPVERMGETAAKSYPLHVICDEDVFSIPAEVSFAEGATSSSVVITYNPAVMQENFAFDVTLELPENEYSKLGNRVLSTQIMVTAPWSDWVPFNEEDPDLAYGTFNYAVGWLFSGEQASIPVLRRYNLTDPSQMQIRLTDWGEGELEDGLTMIVNGPDVTVPLQNTGYDVEFTNGTFRLFVMDWNTYRRLNGVNDDPNAACHYDAERGLFSLYMAYAVQVDGELYVQSSGWEYFQLDGYPDYTMTCEYQGFTTNAEFTESLAMFQATVSEDIAEARFGISRTLDAAALVAGIKDGSFKDIEMLNAGEEQSFTLQLSGPGEYVLAGVAFDADGAPVAEISSNFSITAGVSEWRKAGNATIVDGWITGRFSFGSGDDSRGYEDFPWEVEVLESIQEPGVYALVAPWSNSGWVMANQANAGMGIFEKVNITVDCSDPDCVVIAPQFSGYTMKEGAISSMTENESYYVANMAGLLIQEGQTKDQIKAAGQNNVLNGNKISIPDPQIDINNSGQWGTWNSRPTSVITFDFLPEAEDAAPASLRAPRRAAGFVSAFQRRGATSEVRRVMNMTKKF